MHVQLLPQDQSRFNACSMVETGFLQAAKRGVLASMGRIAPALAVTGTVHAVLDSTKPCSPGALDLRLLGGAILSATVFASINQQQLATVLSAKIDRCS